MAFGRTQQLKGMVYVLYIPFMVDVFGHGDTSILSIDWVITSIADLH